MNITNQPGNNRGAILTLFDGRHIDTQDIVDLQTKFVGNFGFAGEKKDKKLIVAILAEVVIDMDLVGNYNHKKE